MPETLKVGLVQMRCGDDPARNLEQAVAGIREAVRQAPGSSACPSCFARPTSANTKTRATFNWPSLCRARPPKSWPGWPPN
nr:hypothetical protein [Rhodothermus marinus]